MKVRHLLLVAALVAAGQIAFLAWMIAGRAAILREGREIVLKVEPVDPRDLLRGDYVRLGYEISTLQAGLVSNPPSGAATSESAVFVRLRLGEDGFHHAVSASLGVAPASPPAADEIDIRGQLASGARIEPDGFLRVEYGIERFYLPEGEGKAIERDMRIRDFAVKVAVDGQGRAQIKALLDGDKVLYQEPLY